MGVLQEGQRLGPYVIGGLLGRGGMAEVYRATHLTLERSVAIKVIDPALNADPTFPLRFRREAKAAARLTHPNIVTVYDFGEVDALAFLVMELATGGTLRERARKFTTLHEAVEGLSSVCVALQYAHERGVVHRDVKPTNVLVGDDGRELLADFGLARIASENLDFITSWQAIGTPHYLAPERIEGEPADHRADIYALGVMAYEIIAGRLPYAGSTTAEVLRHHLLSPPPSIRSVLPGAPAALDTAIERAMAKQPRARFPSADAFLGQLRQGAAEAPELPIGRGGAPNGTGAQSRPLTPAASPSPAAAVAGIEMEGVALGNAPDYGASDVAAVRAGLETVSIALDPRELAAPEGDPAPEAPAIRSPLLPSWVRGLIGNHRRPTSLNEPQWLALGTSLLVVVFINAVGLWLAIEGRQAAGGNFAAGVTIYISDHLGAFKSALTTLALLLAVLAVLSMRLALAEGRNVSMELYRHLRQYHRFVGYLATIIIFSIGLLTCAGIFGFGTATPRDTLHSLLGSALLVLIVVKIAIVRYFPTQRRHLRLLGEGLLVLFFLVFATSTVPFVWSHIAGTSNSNPYNPYVGKEWKPAPNNP